MAQLDLAGMDDQVSRHNYTVDLTNMINEVLSLRHQMQEQLDIEYKERELQKKRERRLKVRQMSVSNDGGKKSGAAKSLSGENNLKASRRRLDDIEQKMTNLVSVFSGDLLIKEQPIVSQEGLKKIQNHKIVPLLEFQKSTER